MKPQSRKTWSRTGLTLVELLVVVGIIAAMITVMLPTLRNARGQAKSMSCLMQLRQIGGTFHLYAQSNNDRLPDERAQKAWDILLRPYVDDRTQIFICPSDREMKNETDGISYDWRDGFAVDYPSASLAGAQLAHVKRQDALLVFDDISGRHLPATINGAALDTSSRMYAVEDFERNLGQAVQ